MRCICHRAGFLAGAGGVGNIDVYSLLKKDKLGGCLVSSGGGGKGGDGGLLLLSKSLKFGGWIEDSGETYGGWGGWGWEHGGING